MLPLHIALQTPLPTGHIELLARAYPDSILEKDRRGHGPKDDSVDADGPEDVRQLLGQIYHQGQQQQQNMHQHERDVYSISIRSSATETIESETTRTTMHSLMSDDVSTSGEEMMMAQPQNLNVMKTLDLPLVLIELKRTHERLCSLQNFHRSRRPRCIKDVWKQVVWAKEGLGITLIPTTTSSRGKSGATSEHHHVGTATDFNNQKSHKPHRQEPQDKNVRLSSKFEFGSIQVSRILDSIDATVNVGVEQVRKGDTLVAVNDQLVLRSSLESVLQSFKKLRFPIRLTFFQSEIDEDDVVSRKLTGKLSSRQEDELLDQSVSQIEQLCAAIEVSARRDSRAATGLHHNDDR